VEPIVATVGSLLVHVPPPKSESVLVLPTHKLVVPVIIPGTGLTVTVCVAKQPGLDVNVIIDRPEFTPVSRPEDEPIAAFAGMVLVHVPAPDGSVSVADAPTHTLKVPVIGSGGSTTVIVVAALQPALTI
jgi:hypothetical protein